MKTLVIGGTGPTGPYIVKGLQERSHDVSILNRGSHETTEIPSSVNRVIGDPHFRETLISALDGKYYDLIIASYGRLRVIAEVAGNYTNRLISIGGSPSYRGVRYPESLFPQGLQVSVPENAPRVSSEKEFKFGHLVKISEDAVMNGHNAGHYSATHLRYPLVYGPRQPIPCEWWVVKRILDGRKSIVLPDAGLTVMTRGYAENMAQAVLLTVDNENKSKGKIYNCGDTLQFTMAQWVEIISSAMETKLEIISIPNEYAKPSQDIMIGGFNSQHLYFDTFKIRSELGYYDKICPKDALKRTVGWYLETPPSLNASSEANLSEQYKIEDKLKKISSEAKEKYKAMGLSSPDFKHPYAHPKKPGKLKDHLGR